MHQSSATFSGTDRTTPFDKRFLDWLSWAAMGCAAIVFFVVGSQLWQTQSRMELIFRGKIPLLPIGMRTLMATPSFAFALVPALLAAAAVAVQTRLTSRVVATLFHLFVMILGIASLLLARDILMASLMSRMIAE